MKKNNKGFTLMEMLIVVAIIAVLIAIAIPTFTSSLNRARVATDAANIRSGYASAMADILTKQVSAEPTTETTKTYYLQKDGSVGEAAGYTCLGNNKDNQVTEIAGQPVGAWTKGANVSYTYTYATNELKINAPATAATGD